MPKMRGPLPTRAGALYHAIRTALQQAQDPSADLTARRLLAFRAGISHVQLITQADHTVPEQARLQIGEDLNQMLSGMPLSRIEGRRGFWTFDLMISSAVLDPRPDTETLVRIALERFGKQPPPRILDLGTGSGAIILALLTEWPNSQGVAVDISVDALRMAHINASALGLSNRCQFICSDWGRGIMGSFPCIVANPPYIASAAIPGLATAVKNHDPILALDGGEDGLQAYEEIFSDLERLLSPGGLALFEIGFDQGPSMMRLAEKYRFLPPRIHADSGGNHRVLEISSGDK
ncbi:MAG: peptide chain release factor N(5)-glutamine methyltransferase [Alphaproteobacteria bacterium]|nr:peptide chain release factor N(5)-glutamine methyltransferase [Alphaproteobacteria bacterium]